MRRKSLDRRTRYLALALEMAGVAAVVYAVSLASVGLAIGLGGLLIFLTAQFLGEVL